MVKNLPAVERSTKIRFGKNVPEGEDQAENTIVFNASNEAFNVTNENAVYLSPIRNRVDYAEPDVVLLMYDKVTKEITESGEAATSLIGGSTLQIITNRGNTTSNTIVFTGEDGGRGISLMTSNAVGIANLDTQGHTLSVGSNLYVDDTGRDVLVVSGNVSVLGNLQVTGDTTVLYTENTSIKDAFIELGRDNTSSDTTLDLGVLMHRPGALSNVAVGYREGFNEFAIGYTDAQPTDKTFTPKGDEDIDVKVYGNTFVTGNVEVTKALIVSGNTHLEGDNVFITNTMDFLDPTTAIVTDQVSNVQIRLGQLENVSNLASNPRENQVLRYVGSEWSNDYPQQNFMRVKNGYSPEDGRTLYKGNTVYVSATQNAGLVQVKAAQSHVASEMPCIGLVYEDIPPEGEGVVLTYGVLKNLNTTHLTAGGTVYVSNVYSGYHTSAKPDDDVAASPDLIQNLGICTRSHASSGAIFVTGIGRANDIPNAELITDYNNMQYVYVNNTNNDLKKITSANLNIPLTTAVSSSSNSAANAVTLRGLSITSGDGFDGDLVVAGDVTVDTNTLKVDAGTNRVGILTTSPGQTLDVRGAANVGALTTTSASVTDTTHSTSKDTGVLIVTRGGLGVEANIHSTNVFAASHISVGTSATTKALDVRGTSNVGIFTTPDATVTDSTAATSKTTGALKVTGGAGIQGALYGAAATFDGVTSITNATEATSTATGALQVTGGVGIQKDLYARDGHFSTDVSVGSLSNKTIPYVNASKILTDSYISQETNGDLTIAKDLHISGNLFVAGNTSIVSANNLVVSDRIIDIANNNPDHDLDIGILMEHPGHNIGIIHHATDELTIGYTKQGYGDTHVNWDSSNHITMNVWGHVITQNTFTVEYNDVYIVGGGLGINIGRKSDGTPDAKLEVSGNAYISANLTVDTSTLHVDSVANRVGIGKTNPTVPLDVSGATTISGVTKVENGTAATNKTSGALVVTGGVGISGALYGAAATFDGVTDVTNGTAATDKTSGALKVTGGVGISGALYGAAATFDGVTDVTNSTVAYSTATGALKVQGGISTQGNVYVGKDTYITSNLNVDTNTLHVDSVANRVGIGKTDPTVPLDVSGATTISGVTDVTNSTVADSTTTGALKVTGGISTQGNVYVGKDTYITSNLNVDTSTLHVDSVANRVGIGKTDPTVPLDVSGATTISGVTDVTNATVADSTTTGALTVQGGISTQGNVYVGKDTYITSNLNVDTSTLHVDSVANRVGIGKTNPTVALDVAGAGSFSGAVSGTTGTFTGDVSGVAGSFSGAVSGTTGTFTGDVSGVAGSFSGAVSGTTGTFTGDVSGVAGSFSGAVSGTTGTFTGDVSGVAGSFSGAVSGTTGTFTGDVSGVAGSFSGAVSGTTGTFTGVTSVTDGTAATSKSDGALVVTGGVGITGDIYAADATFDNLSVAADTDITGTIGKAKVGYDGTNSDIAVFSHYDNGTSTNYAVAQTAVGASDLNSASGQNTTFSENGAVKMTLSGGNLGISETSPATKLHVAGGTIINSDQVAKKTYAHSATLASGLTTSQATLQLTFTNHVFYAKIVAHLIENTGEDISTLSFECGGGKSDGTTPSNNIALGPVSVFGVSTANPWDSAITTTPTTVSFKPTDAMAAAGRYNVFVEYISQHASGELSSLYRDPAGTPVPLVSDFGY